MKGQSVGGFVWDDVDLEAGLVLDNIWVSERFVSDFVQSIRGVGDEFSQEDLLVGIESVDDQAHQLLDVGVESEMLSWFSLLH